MDDRSLEVYLSSELIRWKNYSFFKKLSSEVIIQDSHHLF